MKKSRCSLQRRHLQPLEIRFTANVIKKKSDLKDNFAENRLSRSTSKKETYINLETELIKYDLLLVKCKPCPEEQDFVQNPEQDSVQNSREVSVQNLVLLKILNWLSVRILNSGFWNSGFRSES